MICARASTKMRCTAGASECNSAALRVATSKRREYSPWDFLSSDRMTSLRSSTATLAALAPAPVSSEAVSLPAMTRDRTPTLKKLMNFSCWSISLRAVAEDFGLHVEQRMLSQSSVRRSENRHGRDASGVVLSEYI